MKADRRAEALCDYHRKGVSASRGKKLRCVQALPTDGIAFGRRDPYLNRAEPIREWTHEEIEQRKDELGVPR